mgnify:CR=1 FL=1
MQNVQSVAGHCSEASGKVIASNTFSLFKPEALGDSAQKYMFILEDVKSNPAGLQKSANKEYISHAVMMKYWLLLVQI